MRAWTWCFALLCSAATAMAQNESRFHADLRREMEALADCKAMFTMVYCAQTIFVGQPIHIAAGSLAPGNGVGFGLALVEHKNFANEWRTTFNFDGVATMNQSWRAGGYIKAFKLAAGTDYHVSPLVYIYSQSISLNRVDYYGLGPATTRQTHTTFGFGENVTGFNIAVPISLRGDAPKFAIVGELNGRFPSLRSGSERNIPSIETIFGESTAPGLRRQPPFVQHAEGLRLIPALFRDTVRLNYLLQFQQFIESGDSVYSFRRFNADFNHEIPLSAFSKSYSSERGQVLPRNGPDECHTGGREDKAMPCPPVGLTKKLVGSINLRAFLSESIANKGSTVPFYFAPTIGGSDLNGNPMLPSYRDYRFRGPNLLLFRGTVEHSLGRLPIGALFSAEAGKIAMRREDISLDHLRHSFSTGLTLRAGGLPLINFLYTWGGNEGSHTIGTISPVLLGSSSRPSLF